MNLKQLFTWVVLAGFLTVPALAQAQTTPPPRLTPSAVKHSWYEGRRIMVEVMTDSAYAPSKDGLRPGAPSTFPFGEHFAIRIGNVVPMRVNVYVLKPEEGQRPIDIDFNPLRAGRLSIDTNPDPDFRLASLDVLPKGESPVSVPNAPKQVKLQVGDNEYNADLYEIRVYVQTFRQPQPMRFAIEFAYATEMLASGGPDWKRIWTPEYVLSMSRTADDGSDMSAGNTTFVAQNPPFNAGLVAVVLGSIAVLVPLGLWLIPLLRKNLNKVEALDPEELAWSRIQPELDKSKTKEGYKLSNKSVRTIVAAVCQYIGKPTLESSQLKTLEHEHDDAVLITAILSPLMAILEGSRKEPLSDDRYKELMERIGLLIPKP